MANASMGNDAARFFYVMRSHDQPLDLPALAHLPRPLSLFVGRVSYEKNIEAFLAMKLPGTRIVCGVGPLEDNLRQRFPDVVWMGVLPRKELAQIYAASDVFVFPSKKIGRAHV